MAPEAELNVELREKTGKGVARKLRAAGKIPAVVYGKGLEPKNIVVDPRQLEDAIAGEAGWNTLLTLRGANGLEGKVVVLKEADLHPLRREMICADFHVINLQEKSTFMVPVHIVGTAAGQKMGGSLQLIRHELEVSCLPGDVPQALEINVSALEIGDTIHIEEVKAPENVELVFDVNFTVVTVVGHKAADDADSSEEEEGAAE
ncbi:50S ribosomal protein L25 [Pelobacter seleniigenes]|uniref:50S ribosomal protein L25 n=1 Tax=Pelobacter seleniigenes TaxID=407188 RepID=UPI0004A77F7E|nr:50S ribosomal protein L25 [Pelobacter seleniigenes]